MDTLLLIQNDKKIDDALKKVPIRHPDGFKVKTTSLKLAEPTSAEAALGVHGDLMGGVRTRKKVARDVKNAILAFSELNFQHEEQKPAAQQQDICQFQIVIMFHQTSANIAEGISQGLSAVQGAEWLFAQPIAHHRAHRV